MMLTAIKKYNNKFPNLAFQLDVTAKNTHDLVQHAFLHDFLHSNFWASPVRSSAIQNWLEAVGEIQNSL